MDAHKRLNDHVEVQRNLKMKLEAQGRFLDRIMEEQKARGSRPSCKSYSYSPLSLPYLCEESESNVKELEVEYDSKVDRSIDHGCQARKRTRLEDDGLDHRYNSRVCRQTLRHKTNSAMPEAAVETSSDKVNGLVNPWRLCTVTQGEEVKSIICLLPVWACCIVFTTVYSEMNTTFVLQGNTMDRHMGIHFRIPSA
ncbi:hypothetical protein RND71_038559 [Anisodus tanguticus]|uniref:MYB-CC type transcription factor LHEQLE-containing domain-containing protein n=1 Tax=Anisodus tanguticus TaxID=243964 RepID=A0AAE1US80_9SOLA|nr:hypothetical protein RND71_038559 [Anisodus tanguticus]